MQVEQHYKLSAVGTSEFN